MIEAAAFVGEGGFSVAGIADEAAGPEDVDAVGGGVEGLDGFFEAGDGAAVLAKDVEELVPEGVGLGVFFRGTPSRGRR